MATVTAGKRTYKPEDLLRMTDGHRFELVAGKLVRRHMGAASSWVGGILYAALLDYCRAQRYGWVWPADSGYQCFPRDPGRVRYPDVSVVRFGRLAGEELPEGHIPVPPDLAVEVVSPRDRAGELDDKVADYLAAGVRLVWVIYPQRRGRVHRPDLSITHVPADGVLDGEQVLPGFRARLADVFPAPQAQP